MVGHAPSAGRILLAILLALPAQAQTTAILIEPVSVPIVREGRTVGTTKARAGTLVQILNRAGDIVEISTPLGPAQTPASNLLPVDERADLGNTPIPSNQPLDNHPTSTASTPPIEKIESTAPPKSKEQPGLASVDITDRIQTDPLLKIKTAHHFLPAGVCHADEIRRDEDPDSQPPQYKRAFGRSNVIMVHPIDPNTPAEIDFSPITRNSEGNLKVAVRDHPQRGDFTLQIEKSDFLIVDKIMDKDLWRSHTIPYSHETVVVKVVANDWFDEFAYITYSISAK